MMIKATLAVLILSVLSATEAFTISVACTLEDIGEGQTVKDCSNGTVTITNSEGEVVETVVFSNDTLELVQFPDSDDCYIARHVHFPDGFSGRLEKDMESVEADKDLSNEMKALAPAECTGTVYTLVDETVEERELAGRRKRECGYRVRLIVITSYHLINGHIVRRRTFLLSRKWEC